MSKRTGSHEGVKIIKGSYFKVVDADDWVNTDVLKETQEKGRARSEERRVGKEC